MLNFGIAKLSSNLSSRTSPITNYSVHLGSLVDGGALDSVMNVPKLCVLRLFLVLQPITKYDFIPSAISHFEYWMYGYREQSSAPASYKALFRSPVYLIVYVRFVFVTSLLTVHHNSY